jgi:SAM-dependent methyltransferase
MPIIKSLVVAVIAAGAAILIFAKLRLSGDVGTLVILALTAGAGLLALVIARFMSLGRAWQVLIVIATPAMVLVPIYQPPTWIFPIVFLGLAGFYINGVREQVPLYLSNRKTQKVLADLVPPETNVTFIDLGCGLGDIVTHIARARPQARVIGVETAPLSFLIAWIRAKMFARANAQIRFQSIWDTDVSNADVVYAFLSPAPMARLNEKLRTEMKPGSRFISNSFAVPGSAPDEIVAVDDARETQLLIWRL